MDDSAGPVLTRRRLLVGAAAATFAALPLRWTGGGPRLPRARAGRGDLTLADFSPLVGSSFEVRARGGMTPVHLPLAEARAGQPHRLDRPGLEGEAFSLIFGDERPKRFEQGTYTLRHPVLGSFPLFLVPVGAGVHGQRYQAVVDRRVPRP